MKKKVLAFLLGFSVITCGINYTVLATDSSVIEQTTSTEELINSTTLDEVWNQEEYNKFGAILQTLNGKASRMPQTGEYSNATLEHFYFYFNIINDKFHSGDYTTYSKTELHKWDKELSHLFNMIKPKEEIVSQIFKDEVMGDINGLRLNSNVDESQLGTLNKYKEELTNILQKDGLTYEELDLYYLKYLREFRYLNNFGESEFSNVESKYPREAIDIASGYAQDAKLKLETIQSNNENKDLIDSSNNIINRIDEITNSEDIEINPANYSEELDSLTNNLIENIKKLESNAAETTIDETTSELDSNATTTIENTGINSVNTSSELDSNATTTIENIGINSVNTSSEEIVTTIKESDSTNENDSDNKIISDKSSNSSNTIINETTITTENNDKNISSEKNSKGLPNTGSNTNYYLIILGLIIIGGGITLIIRQNYKRNK